MTDLNQHRSPAEWEENAPMIKLSRKICLLGDYAVGKTSLARRFVYNLFKARYLSTIGVKVSARTVAVPGRSGIVEVTMMLWDLAGSEEFDRMRSSYMRGASGAVLVCDLTRPATLDSLPGYADDLLATSPEAKIILAANKCDLIEPHHPDALHHLAPEQVEAVAMRLNLPFYCTSAKTGDEVESLFRHLGRLVLMA
jgi:small GTP-binding protein